MKRKKYFGSNLKMYKNVAQTESYLKELADRTRELCMQNPDMELFILPSYTSLETASKSTDPSPCNGRSFRAPTCLWREQH